jgi:hypothetical protein
MGNERFHNENEKKRITWHGGRTIPGLEYMQGKILLRNKVSLADMVMWLIKIKMNWRLWNAEDFSLSIDSRIFLFIDSRIFLSIDSRIFLSIDSRIF